MFKIVGGKILTYLSEYNQTKLQNPQVKARVDFTTKSVLSIAAHVSNLAQDKLKELIARESQERGQDPPKEQPVFGGISESLLTIQIQTTTQQECKYGEFTVAAIPKDLSNKIFDDDHREYAQTVKGVSYVPMTVRFSATHQDPRVTAIFDRDNTIDAYGRFSVFVKPVSKNKSMVVMKLVGHNMTVHLTPQPTIAAVYGEEDNIDNE